MCGAVSTESDRIRLFQSFTSNGCAGSAARESCWIGNVTTSVSLPGGYYTRLPEGPASQCAVDFPVAFRFPRPDLTAADSGQTDYIRYSYRLFIPGGESAVRYRVQAGAFDRRKSGVLNQFAVRAIVRHSTSSGFTPPCFPDQPEYHAPYPADISACTHGLTGRPKRG